MQLKGLRLSLPIIGLLALVQTAWPQGELLPGSTLPEQVSQSLAKERKPPVEPQVQPTLVEPKEQTSPLGPEAEKIKFQLNGIILKGNTVYSDKQLSLLYKNKIGKTISVAELFGIVQSITNFYRNTGYIISRAILPPQHVKNGIVEVRIIEGYIGEVTVSGTPHGAKCMVQWYGNKIKDCPPLQIKRMEKYLLLANEIPATTVKAVLSPSKTKTGAADLTLVTENKRIIGYFSYDNYGTRYIGPQQMTANLGASSLLRSGDLTQFTMTKTPKGGELTYMDLNYNTLLNAEGMRWQVGATRAVTHPLFVLAPVKIQGINPNYYTTLQFPMIRSRTESLTLRMAFNYLDSWVTTFNAKLYTDHLRNLDFGLTYNFADRWAGANMINADLRQGLPIWGYTNDTSLTAQTSRPGGRGDYTKIAAQISRLQAIKGPFSAYGILSGQWAFNPLLASEQFTFGGPVLGRGYDIAELIGDRGAAASIEARYDWAIGRILDRLQLYVFYDAGMIWNILNIPGTPKKLSGISTGFGTRFYFSKYISGNFMWTQTLTKQVAAEELIGQGRRPRVFFSIIAALN